MNRSGSLQVKAVGTADAIVAPYSAKRVLLQMCCSTHNGQVWFSPEIMTAVEQGIFIDSGVMNGLGFVLTRELHGDLVTREWHAFCASNGQHVVVLEVIDDSITPQQ